MSHPFGDRLSQYLHRKHGLSQAKLAEGILQAPAIISNMCKGGRLSGPQARARVLQIMRWLWQEGVLSQLDEANALLDAAGMAALRPNVTAEAAFIAHLASTSLPPPIVATTPRLAKANSVPQALPVPLTPLIGRTQTMMAIGKFLLVEKCRLLTLVGPPGVGKTRLALQVAAELATAFADGLFFVPLATLRNATLAPALICQALGLQESSLSPLDHLKLYLREKETLLVLDNLEQLLALAPTLVELLTACPQLHLLTTSRAPLGVRAERQFPVLPLTLPDLAQLPDNTILAQVDAIALFVERGQRVQPTFALTPENAASIATICTRLDGLPLAIELVAARLKVLPPAALLARLDGTMLLSSDGLRDSTPRQQTLRDAIQWSYDLLPPVEQHLLAQLGIFSGGFTLAAAEMVCRNELPAPAAVLTGITSLVDKSLLQVATGQADPRFTMLETIHEYALEQLAASGKLPTIQRCHAEYCLHLAETAESYLRTGEQITWLKRLDAERANLRAALAWSISESGDPVLGLRLANALGYYWYLRALCVEGGRWLEAVFARVGDAAPPTLRAWALYNGCVQANGLDDLARGFAYGEAAQQLAEQLNDQQLLAHLAIPLGQLIHCRDGRAHFKAWVSEGLKRAQRLNDPWLITSFLVRLTSFTSDDPDQQMRLQVEALTQARATGDRVLIYCALEHMAAMLFVQGDLLQAQRYYEEALQAARELEDKRIMMVVLQCGDLARVQGQTEQAAAYFQEGLLLAEQTSTVGLIGAAHQRCARLAQSQGKASEALQLHQKGLRLVQPLGHRLFVAPCLILIATLADLPDTSITTVQATRLCGAAVALLPFEHMWLLPTDLPDMQHTLTTTQARLADPIFAAAWAEGQQMTLDEAVAYALALPVLGHETRWRA